MNSTLLSLGLLSASALLAQSPTRTLPQSQFAELDGKLNLPQGLTRAQGILAAELDGRPDNDLLRWGQFGLEWLPGLGELRFAEPVSMLTAPIGLATVADVDGDGDRDVAVIVGSAPRSTLRLLRNDGAGGFTEDQAAVVGTNLRPLTPLFAGDLDGDGVDELVTMESSGTAVLSLNAAGVFQTVAVIPGLDPVALTDMDGDGDLDLVREARAGTAVEVLANDGSASFAAPTVIPTDGVGNTRRVFVGDVNGDQAVDLVNVGLEPTGDALLSVLLGDGAGGFALPSPPSRLPFALLAGAVGDLDLDGRDEVILSGILETAVFEWFSSAFLDVTASHLSVAGALRPIRLDDVDGDGDLDVLGESTSLTILVNDGAGVLDVIQPNEPLYSFDRRSVLVTDVNGDGLDDIVSTRGLAIGSNPLGTPGLDSSTFPDVVAGTPLRGQFGGRTDQMLFLSDTPALFANSFGSWLRLENPFPATQGVRGGAVGDFNGSLFTDVLVFTKTGLVLWTVDSGAYVAQPAGVFPSSPAVGRAFAEDFDQDGDLDIVGSAERVVFVLENDGTGFFTDVSQTVLPGGSTPFPGSVRLVDLDGDGVREILSAQIGSSRLEVLANQGGTYLASAIPLGAPIVFGVTSGDVDLDGDPDVVVSTTNGRGLLLNDGAGGLTRAPRARAGSEVTTLPALSDLDGDGDLDLVSGRILRNTHRHVRVPFQPVLGGNLEIDLWAAPGYGASAYAATLVAGRTLSRPLSNPLGGGNLGINPNDALLLPLILVSGTATQSLAIPNDPALRGQEFAVQTLFLEPPSGGRGPDIRFSNVETGFVLR